jgi:hypothetical protein
MASVIISGDTSGTVTLQAPAVVGGAPVLTLPTTSGTLITTASGQTLTSPTITGAVMSSMASSVITSATAQTTTSGTSIDFTGIPAWAKRITVMFSAVSTSSTSNFLIQLGTSGGIVSTGYFSTTVSVRTTSQQTFSTAGYIIINPTGVTESMSGLYIIANLTGNTWVGSGTTISGTSGIATSAGTVPLGGTLTTLRLTTTGVDLFDAGSVNILYE